MFVVVSFRNGNLLLLHDRRRDEEGAVVHDMKMSHSTMREASPAGTPETNVDLGRMVATMKVLPVLLKKAIIRGTMPRGFGF